MNRSHSFYIVGAIKIINKSICVVLYAGETKGDRRRPDTHFKGQHSWQYVINHFEIPTFTKKSEVERGLILALENFQKLYKGKVKLINQLKNENSKPYYILNGDYSSKPQDIGNQISTDSPWNGSSSTLRDFVSFALSKNKTIANSFVLPHAKQQKFEVLQLS